MTAIAPFIRPEAQRSISHAKSRRRRMGFASPPRFEQVLSGLRTNATSLIKVVERISVSGRSCRVAFSVHIKGYNAQPGGLFTGANDQFRTWVENPTCSIDEIPE